jgi:hypothetical protein
MTRYERLSSDQISRRTVLKGAGAIGVGLGIGSTWRSAMAQTPVASPLASPDAGVVETIQDILNITATTEAFGVTFLGTAIANIEAGNYAQSFSLPEVQVLKAAQAQEQFHIDFFLSLGGVFLTETFTIPPEALTDRDTLFSAIVLQETVEIAAQLAAFQTFTALERPDLVKVSFQYAAEEAEHRLVANYALGVRPANDVAFAPVLFATVAEFYASLEERGIIGGTGTEITYPGPNVIDASMVIETVPGGMEVDCAAA